MFFYSEAIEQIGPTDPSFSNVSLLLKADGANNSTTFVDSSANNLATLFLIYFPPVNAEFGGTELHKKATKKP
jgi:hypothetical protein